MHEMMSYPRYYIVYTNKSGLKFNGFLQRRGRSIVGAREFKDTIRKPIGLTKQGSRDRTIMDPVWV